EVIATVGDNLSEAILHVARRNAVTRIIVGKPESFSFLDRWRGNHLIDRLIRESGSIEVSVVRAERDDGGSEVPASQPVRARFELRPYAIALGIVAIVTLACLPLQELIGFRAISMIYLLAVALSALLVGRGPVLLMATLSALLWDYLFLPPRF